MCVESHPAVLGTQTQEAAVAAALGTGAVTAGSGDRNACCSCQGQGQALRVGSSSAKLLVNIYITFELLLGTVLGFIALRLG